MAHIFLSDDIKCLFMNKFVVIIGNSIQRSMYKDLVILLQKNKYLTDKQLRMKGEMTFEDDYLIAGGVKSGLYNGVNYREVREYKTDYHWIKFYFVTRCYSAYVETVLNELSTHPQPDVLILNSCLWDITRYGHDDHSIEQFKNNIVKLCMKIQQVVSENCLVLWTSALPISKDARGGVVVPQSEFLKSSACLELLEANFLSCSQFAEFGFDVLDIHFHLRNHIHRRAEDGVHWDMTAHRRITNLILTHIAEAWDVTMPCNIEKFFNQTNTIDSVQEFQEVNLLRNDSSRKHRCTKEFQEVNLLRNDSSRKHRCTKEFQEVNFLRNKSSRKHRCTKEFQEVNFVRNKSSRKQSSRQEFQEVNFPRNKSRKQSSRQEFRACSQTKRKLKENRSYPRIQQNRVKPFSERQQHKYNSNVQKVKQDCYQPGSSTYWHDEEKESYWNNDQTDYKDWPRRTNHFEEEWQPYEERDYIQYRHVNRTRSRFTPYSHVY